MNGQDDQGQGSGRQWQADRGLQWGASAPPPPGQGPPGPGQPYPGWQTGPGRKGVFSRHPLLTILIFFLAIMTLTLVIGLLAGSGAKTGVVSRVSFKDKVGVVNVEGLILRSKKVVDQIHRFEDDDSVKAVVMRVDSPGGVVGASQEIYREVQKLSDKKPVVVSMGSVAASGAYYISSPATVIFANQGTITGSIGVIMEVTSLEGLFRWMKIKNQIIKSGKYKDIASPYRELTSEEKSLLKSFVDQLHEQFVGDVSKGRGISMEELQTIADGRILNGNRARELGLVDEIGNLWDAIDHAAKEAGIEGEPKVIWPKPHRFSPFERIINKVAPGLAKDEILHSPVRALYVLDMN